MITPHGSAKLETRYISDEQTRREKLQRAEQLPSIVLSSGAAANAVMLGAGYFSPLTGFMDASDTIQIAENMHTASGLFWPVPVLNAVKDASAIKGTDYIALRDPNVEGHPILAVQEVKNIETLTESQLELIAKKVFGTLDNNHPGVANFLAAGNTIISGPIEVFNFSYFEKDFPETFRTAQQIRDSIQALGWNKVVAFQTRNPMHRAHEELCKMAKEAVDADGILIHMLLGKLKSGDIPASVRDAAIRKMVELYFPKDSAMITGYGFDMLYAGPREAVLHAVFRQNAGCTHLIVGRDHAGVGDYYSAFEAQEIFDNEVPADALKIEIFKADHTAYSRKLNKVVMMRDAQDHTKDDFVLLSGTKVREMLSEGKALPEEFARPEVAQILMEYYQQKEVV